MKTLCELSTEAQTWCHLGDSESEIYVKILDAYYRVKGLQRVHVDCADKTVFIISTEALNEM